VLNKILRRQIFLEKRTSLPRCQFEHEAMIVAMGYFQQNKYLIINLVVGIFKVFLLCPGGVV
jgi:hypothetical protein